MKLCIRIISLVISVCLFSTYALADDMFEMSSIVTEHYTEDILGNFEEEAGSNSVDAGVAADFSSIKAKSLILMDQDSGTVMYETNADERLAPASITKIMSLLLFMEALDEGKLRLDSQVSCSEHAASMGGSQIWLEPNETMAVHELLKAVAIGSANDATVALAEAIAGSEENFVGMMNEKAKELVMVNTNFANCSGLDAENHYTSARDIALMSQALMKHHEIYDYTTVWMDTLRNGATQLVNTNKLVRFYDGATGLKTGTTDDAGCCLSATATRDGLNLIAVVLGCPSSNDRFSAAKALLNFGFANYCRVSVPVELDDKVMMPVKNGTELEVKLKAKPTVELLTEKTNKEKFSVKIQLPESVTAPVMEGEVIGRVDIMLGDEKVSSVDITASNDVAQMNLAKALSRMMKGLFSV